MGTLTLVRHGESQYNKENKFTGWQDPDLTEHGRQEMKWAGVHLLGTHFHVAYCSSLQRTIQSTQILLDSAGEQGTPVVLVSELNERSYGNLEGLSKHDAEIEFGAEQVKRWRRGYREVPPNGESLYMAELRILPYFEGHILPAADIDSVLVCAHGNTLRAIVRSIEGLDEVALMALDIPTGSIRSYKIAQGRPILSEIWSPLQSDPGGSLL
jgi:2,3-bisphosphoglycerate-dependent phosphoglycerate mutase